MVVGGFAAFSLAPHTLVITPAKEVVHVEVNDGHRGHAGAPVAVRGPR